MTGDISLNDFEIRADDQNKADDAHETTNAVGQ